MATEIGFRVRFFATVAAQDFAEEGVILAGQDGDDSIDVACGWIHLHGRR
jgi:hypothetical protein